MVKKILLYIMAVGYIGAGINHFWHPANYLLIIPPFLPWHEFLNYAAGVAEIGLGILLFFPRFRKPAAILIMIMLIFFIPVHVYMIMAGGCMGGGRCIPLWILWVRLFPLQFLLIWWAWWVRE